MIKIKSRLKTLKDITKTPDATGWMYDEQAFLVYSLIKYLKPELIIQTGHSWGKSALFILEALTDGLLDQEYLESKTQKSDDSYNSFVEDNKPRQRAKKFISVDPFINPERHIPPNFQGGINYLIETYGDIFEFRRERSDDFFKNFKMVGKNSRVMGVVDGLHTYEGCFSDLVGLAQLNSLCMIVDDVLYMDKLNQCCKDFSSQYGYSYLNVNLYNGMGLLMRRS